METLSELVTVLFIFCLGFITLTEYFYHIIKNKLKKHHGHNSAGLCGCSVGFDKRKEGDKGVFHTGNGASRLLAFLLTTLSLSIVFYNQYYNFN